MKHVVLTLIASVAWLGLACSEKDGGRVDVPSSMWTETQAEAITSIRGLSVHVKHCQGLGPGRKVGATIFYSRFACLAGARLAYDPIDTVAVTYVLRPLVTYSGSSSRYAVTNVHFGGLGVP